VRLAGPISQGGIVGQILASRITCRRSAPSHIAVFGECGVVTYFPRPLTGFIFERFAAVLLCVLTENPAEQRLFTENMRMMRPLR
jgi:hypothetical protein